MSYLTALQLRLVCRRLARGRMGRAQRARQLRGAIVGFFLGAGLTVAGCAGLGILP